jgi:hypothetical protein
MNHSVVVQVQKDLMLTPQLVNALKKKQGEMLLSNIASLLKQKSFMSRLSTKSRRGPSTYKPPVLRNPQGQLPEQIKQQDRQACSLPRFSCYAE